MPLDNNNATLLFDCISKGGIRYQGGVIPILPSLSRQVRSLWSG